MRLHHFCAWKAHKHQGSMWSWSLVSVFMMLSHWAQFSAGRSACWRGGGLKWFWVRVSTWIASLHVHTWHTNTGCHNHNVIVLFHDYLMRNKIKQLRTLESTVKLKGQLLIFYIFKREKHAYSGETSVTRFVSTVSVYFYSTTSPPKKRFWELSTKLMRKMADVSQTAEGGSAQWGSTACADTARAAPEGVVTCFSFCLDSDAQNNTKPLQFIFYCRAERN